MLKQLIQEAKSKYAQDYEGDANLDLQLDAFEEGMVTAFSLMFEHSLRGSLSFDLIE